MPVSFRSAGSLKKIWGGASGDGLKNQATMFHTENVGIARNYYAEITEEAICFCVFLRFVTFLYLFELFIRFSGRKH